jgi:DNA-binding NarL/FixJ family response regulator
MEASGRTGAGQAPTEDTAIVRVTSINLSGQQSGFQLLAAVKHGPALRAIPVIVFSMFDQPEIGHKSYVLGANCYITKPRELDAFFGAIHTIVEHWFTGNVPLDPASLP